MTQEKYLNTVTGGIDAQINTLTVAQVEAFHEDVVAEVYGAIQRFPNPELSMTALTEEVGELAKALLSEPWNRVRAEAVQVAAMALRVACEGDPSLEAYRIRKRLDLASEFNSGMPGLLEQPAPSFATDEPMFV